MDPGTLYFVLCGIVGWFGRNRLVGFWGSSLLAFFVSPLLVAASIAIFTTAKSPPAAVGWGLGSMLRRNKPATTAIQG